jgi:hypothetical protein
MKRACNRSKHIPINGSYSSLYAKMGLIIVGEQAETSRHESITWMQKKEYLWMFIMWPLKP